MAPKAEACADCTQNCHLMHRKDRNPSPVSTTFFKVMIGEEYSEVMFLPPRFANSVQKKVGKTTWLHDSCGEKWKVRYTKINGLMAFEEGWNTFWLAHGLKMGDFLVFHYIMESHFVVLMYGESGCPENRHYGFTGHQMQESRKEEKLTTVDHHTPSNAITNGHHNKIKDSDGSQEKGTKVKKKRTDDDVMPPNVSISNTDKSLVASSSRSKPSDSDKETSQRSKPLVNTNPDIDKSHKTVCEIPTVVKNNKQDLGVKSLHEVSIPEIIPEKTSGGRKDDVALAAGGGGDEIEIIEPGKVLETSSKKLTEKPMQIAYKSPLKKRSRNTMLPMTPSKIVKKESQTDVSASKLSNVGASPKPIVTPPNIAIKEPIAAQEKDKSHNVGLPHNVETPKTKLTMNGDSIKSSPGAKTDIQNSHKEENNDILPKVKPEPVDYEESPPEVSTNTSFTAVMTSYKYLELPTWVKFKSKVILLRNKSDLWPVLYQSKVGMKALTQSWEAFAMQRGIQVGDTCEFELQSEASSNSTCSVFTVHVSRIR